MLSMLRDLMLHKWYANASLIRAIRQHGQAAQDLELKKTLHHILVANRYWLLLSQGLPFIVEEESRVPDSLDTLADHYRETQAQESEWMARLQANDLARTLETPFIPGHSCSVSEALMQVCMHSHGHRAQCAATLRSMGGTPPMLDFILWLKERPDADWASS
jgi:uncharacterized damage-inducible protein DinB